MVLRAGVWSRVSLPKMSLGDHQIKVDLLGTGQRRGIWSRLLAQIWCRTLRVPTKKVLASKRGPGGIGCICSWPRFGSEAAGPNELRGTLYHRRIPGGVEAWDQIQAHMSQVIVRLPQKIIFTFLG